MRSIERGRVLRLATSATTAVLLATSLALVAGGSPAAAATGDITTYVAGDASGPTGITGGPDGNLWFTSADNRIGRIDPDDGSVTTFVDPAGNVSLPQRITAGPDGNLWFSSFSNNRIGRIDPDDGSITTYVDPSGNVSSPVGVTGGPDGNVWFTSSNNGRIGRIDPDDGSITTYVDPASNVVSPQGITAGPDGNLWFTSANNGRIGRIDPDDGSITTYVDPAGNLTTPGSITAGPDGNLWFTVVGGNRIGRIDPDDGSITTYVDPAGNVASPLGIAASPDGTLWFTNFLNGRVGRIDPATGSITTFTDPEGEVPRSHQIAAGADGDLWFTMALTNRIGRIEADAPVAAVPGAPTNVDATGGDGGAEVTWAAPTSNGGSAVTSYVVYRDGVEVHETANGSTFAYTDTGLTNGTTYSYEVAAVNAMGEGTRSTAVTATPEAPVVEPTFADVGLTHPFFADIEWMAAEGISTGYPGSPKPTYQPSAPVTRQAMSAFMYRLAGEPAFTPPATPSFPDVGPSHPFSTEVEWMAEVGIADGYADGRYHPDAPVSRQAMSAFLYRLAGEPTFTAPGSATFTDVRTDHQFFVEVEWMVAEEISEGYQPGPTYRPLEPVTRQAMSAFMHRLADGPGVGV